VVSKGSRAREQVPASVDSFAWLALYLAEDRPPLVEGGPVWWTRTQQPRPLTYHAARAVLQRANTVLGTNWTLHDLRHSAAMRMVHDRQLSLTDVQWVLGHAHLTTTQLYLTPTQDEVVQAVRAHHARRARRREDSPPPAPGYDPQSLAVLFGRA
jgi:site-specific recombinase XerD